MEEEVGLMIFNVVKVLDVFVFFGVFVEFVYFYCVEFDIVFWVGIYGFDEEGEDI